MKAKATRFRTTYNKGVRVREARNDYAAAKQLALITVAKLAQGELDVLTVIGVSFLRLGDVASLRLRWAQIERRGAETQRRETRVGRV